MDVVGDRDKCRAREESHKRQLAHTSLSVCPDCRGVARDWLTEVLNQPVSQFTSYCSICQTHISAAMNVSLCVSKLLSPFFPLSTVDDYSPHQKVREIVKRKKNLPKK